MPPMFSFLKTSPRTRPARQGFVLAQFCLLLVAMLGFLGFAIYYGQIGLLQNELQKNANMGAMMGAAALYDGPTQGAPVASPDRARIAAANAFTRAVGASAVLQGLKAQVTSINTAGNTVTLSSQGLIPTPFFALVGINEVQINVYGRASAAKEVLPNIGPINGTTPFRSINLRQPLLDGPGPDMHIVPTSLEGYIPEVCAGNVDCYPVGAASKPGTGGSISDRLMGGRNTRLLFGEQYIDLGATGPGYTGFVKKANQVKLTHDGVDDAMVGTTRYLYLVPPATTGFGLIEIYHHSILCDQTCVYPPGFAPMS
jgi:Flp pilus assembly protein TadG